MNMRLRKLEKCDILHFYPPIQSIPTALPEKKVLG